MSKTISLEEHDSRVSELLKFNNEMEERARQAERLIAHLRARFDYMLSDDPTFDATDGAHPAWWRGNDSGVAATVDIVNKILDGKPGLGLFQSEKLNALHTRLTAMLSTSE